MQGPLEQRAHESWIELEVGAPVRRLDPKLGERARPLAGRPVVVGQNDAVRRVSDPIHEPQRRAREKTVAVLDTETDALKFLVVAAA